MDEKATMTNEQDLNKIAAMAREKVFEKAPDEVDTSVRHEIDNDPVILTAPVIPEDPQPNDEGPVMVTGMLPDEPVNAPEIDPDLMSDHIPIKELNVVDPVFTDAPKDEDEALADAVISGGSINKITDDDLRATMPHIPEEVLKEKIVDLKSQLRTYHDEIIDDGITLEEAMTATRNRMKRLGKQYDTEWLTEHPDTGVIEINKKDAMDLQLTEEEHDKLKTVNQIKLIVIENKELETIKLAKVPTEHKVEYINALDDALAKYGTVLPILSDFCEFKGAQIIQLAKAVQYEDDPIEAVLARKGYLLYDRFIGGGKFRRYDENRKSVMSYTEFANLYPFQDIDLGLYAIMVASSMDENEATITCNSCKHKFIQKYNLKEILQLDGISDAFKNRMSDIMAHRGSPDYLGQLHDDFSQVRRYKSPYTQNIYDITFPSIAKAMNIFKTIDQQDEVMVYCSALGLYLTSLFIYNKETDDYIEIKDYETNLMLDALQRVPDEDFKLLLAEISEHMVYEPKFVISGRCPQCGEKISINVAVQDLIFLRAQSSGMVTR